MSFFLKKSPKRQKNILASLDIGGSKVCCAIATLDNRQQDAMRIIGVGQQISRGVRNGVIVNLEALEDSILNAVHTAEQMAGETISEVYVNFSSNCARSHTVDVEISLGNHPVDETHIRKLLAIARNTPAMEGHQVVHALPITYAIDNQVGIRDPRGMLGQKLACSVHLVSAATGLMRNLTNCIGRCHLDVAGFVVAPYASGLATLVEDELELGVTVIDLGGGGSSIASFLDGTLVHVDNVSVGGMHITSDIARGLSTPVSQAERLKTLYGTTIMSSSDERETILVPQLGEGHASPHTNHVPKSMLTHIIRARAEETLELTWRQLQQSGMDRLVCQRVVLTGGGSQLPGIREMAASLTGKQIRIGTPIGMGGGEISASPMFATSAGLLKYAARDSMSSQDVRFLNKENGHFWSNMSQWVRENF